MRDYGTVSPKFWRAGTGKALRGDAHAQLLALYLMTSPHSNMIGVYFCTVHSMAYETGIPFEGASKALRRLVDEGFCVFDEESDEVFVVKMAAHQIAERLEAKDNRCKSVARELALVNSSKLQQAFHEVYAVAFNLVTPAAQTVDNTVDSSPLRSPFEAPSKPRAGAGAGAGTGAGAGGASTPAGGAGPPPPTQPMGEEFKKFIESLRPELDAAMVFANFTDHYPPAKRTLAQWKKWVRREHAGAPPSSTGYAGQVPPVTVQGRAGPDPTIERLKADAMRAVKPPPEVRELAERLKRPAAEESS